MKNVLLIMLIGMMAICSHTKTIYDISIFDDTEVSSLAKFVANQDTFSIKQFIKNHPQINIDSPDPFLGSNLLIWSIYNDKYESFRMLLNAGANPNFVCLKDGETPLISASRFLNEKGVDSRYISNLLQHGADGSLISIDNSEGHTIYRSPIVYAINHIEYIRLFVEQGGLDVNFSVNGISIVQWAIMEKKIDVLFYLVVDRNADITGVMKEVMEIPGETWPVTLLIDEVKQMDFPENSEELFMKNEIIRKYNEQVANVR